MRSDFVVATLLAGALSLCSIHAQASPELAKAHNCMNCHAVDRKLVGPAFRDIARRYAGQAGAADRLAKKIIGGGSGAWGPVAMAANPKVTPDQARTLAVWVLATK
jgi:cytochrome c